MRLRRRRRRLGRGEEGARLGAVRIGRGSRQAMLGVAVAAVAAALLAILVWPADPSGAPATGLAAPPWPVLEVGDPAPLRADHAAVWAPVRRAATARAAPDAASAAVASVAMRTPERTANTVPVLDRRRAAGGRVWVKVRLAVLPNGTTGWLPRSAVGGYHRIHARLVIDRARRLATLLRDGRVVFRAPVGVGRPQWPTPRGHFHVRNRLSDYGGGFYGPLAFGTSARSAVLTDWPDGGFVGIHGTNRPDLIPGAVSHGCVRMRNGDILRLGKLMPVGTPLEIH